VKLYESPDQTAAIIRMEKKRNQCGDAMNCRLIALGVILGLNLSLLRAASPGEQAVVIYNTRVPESKGVAEHYAELRHVPTNQVWGFELPSREEISRAEFRDALQRPLAKRLEDAKLWHIASHIVPPSSNQPGRVEWKPAKSAIRYAVLCYGVPLRITKANNLKEDLAENVRPELRRNEAAVDSELALLPLIEQKLPLAGPLRNPLYGSTNANSLHPTNGVLLVSRLDGPTAAIARGLVDKAIQAESDGLWGRAYFDLRMTTDPSLKIGDDWIRGAAELCRRLGFETVVDENPGTFPAGFPMSQIAVYIGWYDEHVSGPFTRPTVEFMPGAFAYHLHSFSAASLRSTTRNWVGPLLAKGATITMGCVDEPYLTGTPEPAVLMARLIFYQFSFGEAAYAAQSVLSWQTTVVGDPLFHPFEKDPEKIHQELERKGSKNLEWSYLRLLNLNLANDKPVADWVAFAEQLELTKKSAVLSEKLGDLYALQGKPSSAVHAYGEALKLDPSPQQRLRLMLALGDKLVGLDRTQEAYENYQQLLKLSADYPDKATLYKKLIALAQKLSKQADVEKYEAESKRL
jgi:uncharacterized protein (TIGR03790 family)